MLNPWWERWPERLEYELQALDEAGIPYARDEAAYAAGVLQLRVSLVVGGERLALIAVFPDSYPYFRFEIYAPDLALDHHQNSLEKNLCLIGQSTANWRVGDTLAAFLQERLPTVLETGRSDNLAAVTGQEEPQAEPFSAYYQYTAPTMALVDSTWELDQAHTRGKLLVGVEWKSVWLRGAILEVQADDGQVLAAADSALAERYPRSIKARWIRCSAPIEEKNPGQFIAQLAEQDPSLGSPKWVPVDDGSIDIIGVVFPEETGWRQAGFGWIFVVRAKGRSINGGKGYVTYFARAGRAGRADLAERVPELAPLTGCCVAVIGLGGLGAPSALEFARAGVGELRLLDYDVVEPGTIVRWPLGLRAAGFAKTEILKQFLGVEYPFTRVVTWHHRIGGTRKDASPEAGESDLIVVEQVLDGVDLVYDATAEEGVHYFLDRLCWERQIPYLCVSSTNGAWGGRIVRVRPGLNAGCWSCYLCAEADGSIPMPPAAPGSGVQPLGCASPTFTGAGFELAQFTLSGVRLAVSTLTGSHAAGYGEAGWDIAIGALRGDQGQLIPPQWQTFPLKQHPSCPVCGAR